MRTVLAAAMAVALASLPAAGEDWPGWRGPTGQGLSAETGVPTEWSATQNVVWKTPIPGEGWSSPIVFGDRVFATAATEGGQSFHVLCLGRDDGKVLWDQEVLRQPTENKMPQNSYASATPVTDGRRVYVLAADGSLAALAMDGRTVWTNRDFKYYSQHGLGVSPILYGDLVIVPFDGSSRGPDKGVGWHTSWEEAVILACDKATGQVRWRAKRGPSRIAHVTPRVLLEGPRAILVSGAGDVIQGFDLATGERLWSATSPGEGVVPSIVLGDGLAFATSGFGSPTIRAVRTGGTGDVTKTHIAWEQSKDVPMIPSMLYVKPWLFTITEGGVVRCLKAETGEQVWRQRLGGNYSASPLWAEGRIYFLGENGETTLVEAGPEFKVLARNTIGEKCCASPAVSAGRLFLRSEKHLWCIGPGAAK